MKDPISESTFDKIESFVGEDKRKPVSESNSQNMLREAKVDFNPNTDFWTIESAFKRQVRQSVYSQIDNDDNFTRVEMGKGGREVPPITFSLVSAPTAEYKTFKLVVETSFAIPRGDADKFAVLLTLYEGDGGNRVGKETIKFDKRTNLQSIAKRVVNTLVQQHFESNELGDTPIHESQQDFK